MASEFIGETTGKVYGALLRLIGQGIARCRPNQRVELMKGHDSIDEARYPAHPSFSTYEVLDVLDPSVDVLDGIGKVAPDQINHDIAERIQRLPPLRNPLLSDNGEEGMVANGTRYSDDEFSDDDEVMEDELSSVQASAGQVRAEMQTLGKATKVTFEDARDPNAERLEYVKKHLLLLCDSSFGFVRQSRRNKWTVDFEPLVSKLQEVELETIIEQTCGQRAVRLVRILKEKGKMDEKSLPGLALMSKKEFQVNMLQLELSGFVELQEVPRDNNRTAQRTLFLWYFDKDRSLGKTLDKLYKSMIRCLQTMEVQRQKEKHLLTHVERTDVKGHEEEALPLETYQKYLRHLGLQRKLLGQVMRLDDLVASIRDY